MTIEQAVEKYGFSQLGQAVSGSDITRIEEARAVQEVQASVIMAKRFPRDENQAFVKIIKACQRPSLAESAMYAYPRGKTVVKGSSIRLAEVLAQNFGNILYGIEEISQQNGVSIAQAFAWDIETNVRVVKKFHVPHKRYANKQITELTDPRDIYELVANQGARRLRACILQIIPGDIQEAAKEECAKTLKNNNKEPIQDRVKKLILAFEEIGVKITDIEEKLGHKLDTIIESEIVDLRLTYKSIKDGEVRREDFFGNKDKKTEIAEDEGKTKAEKIVNKLQNKKQEFVNTETGEIKTVNISNDKKISEEEEKMIDEFFNGTQTTGS